VRARVFVKSERCPVMPQPQTERLDELLVEVRHGDAVLTEVDVWYGKARRIVVERRGEAKLIKLVPVSPLVIVDVFTDMERGAGDEGFRETEEYETWWVYTKRWGWLVSGQRHLVSDGATVKRRSCTNFYLPEDVRRALERAIHERARRWG
jgi:hypothetical protein